MFDWCDQVWIQKLDTPCVCNEIELHGQVFVNHSRLIGQHSLGGSPI